jgi:geranylgeranyl diphosphate synthase type II
MADGEPFRWLHAPMGEYPSRPGKAVRPALCLSAGRAFGAEPEARLGSLWQLNCCTMRFSRSTM